MLEVGDVVYLKSGSPPLTVTNVRSHGNKWLAVTISWENDEGLQTAELPEACLTKKEVLNE